MIRNFFITAFRNILKHKTYSVINFIGLTCGLTLSLIVISYLRHELSFDRFQEKADRLYRLSYAAPNGMKLASTPPPIAPVMTEYFPGVEAAARLYGRNVGITQGEGKASRSFEETDVLFADSSLMKMFSFQFIAGSPVGALQEPFTMMITEEMAKKYFGDKDAIGQTLLLGGRLSFRVTAVVKNFPKTSHIRFHLMLPYHHMFDLEDDVAREVMRKNLASNFVISHSYTYVLLKPGHHPEAVDKAMPDFLKKYCPPQLMVGQKFTLLPVTSIHLKSDLVAEPSPTNTMANIYIFGAIGVLTLLIGCINYINLSTAQSFTRIREIGIRKILGAAKRELIFQFLAESFLFCLIAMILSFGALYLILPWFDQITDTPLDFATIVDAALLFSAASLLLIVTLVAGGYPAWFVAQFTTISSLKGEEMRGGPFGRKVLVVFQLMIACALLSGSLMLIKQLDFLRQRPLGFDKMRVLTIPLFSQNLNAIFSTADSTLRARIQTFRDRVEGQEGVESTTASSASPGLGTIYRGTIPEGFTKEDNLFIADLGVDFDFLKAYGIQMKAGRMFSRDHRTDEQTAFLVNETAVKEFRWETPEKALGKTIDREGKKGKVIGVVKDFNMETMTSPISALIVEIDPNQWSAISVRIKSGNSSQTIEKINREWNAAFPEKTFEYTFLEEQLNQLYSNETNFGKTIQTFTAVAMLICCLGVYGLVLFVVRRKVKEIGVRKVLGASVGSILRLIYQEFVWLILLGFVFAVPISYYFIRQWLKHFVFHTTIDFVTYATSFMLIAMVVTITITWHAVKASLANPVNSLRSE